MLGAIAQILIADGVGSTLRRATGQRSTVLPVHSMPATRWPGPLTWGVSHGGGSGRGDGGQARSQVKAGMAWVREPAVQIRP